MAESNASLNAKIDTLSDTLDSERVEFLAILKAIRESVPAGPLTQEQADALGAKVDAAIAKAQGVVNATD